LPQLYISDYKSDGINNSKVIGEAVDFWRVLKYIIITLFAIIVWVALQNDSYIFSLFNFSGYLFVSLYLFKLTAIHDDTLKNSDARYSILIGWIIWTILQLWRPVGNVLTGYEIPYVYEDSIN